MIPRIFLILLLRYYLCYSTKDISTDGKQAGVSPLGISIGVVLIIMQLMETTTLPNTDSNFIVVAIGNWLNFRYTIFSQFKFNFSL